MALYSFKDENEHGQKTNKIPFSKRVTSQTLYSFRLKLCMYYGLNFEYAVR